MGQARTALRHPRPTYAPAVRRATSLRIDTGDLAEIDRLAKLHHLTRTDYIINKALDRIGSIGLDDRVDGVEQRLDRLERRLELSYD